jgi:hypothetical protein
VCSWDTTEEDIRDFVNYLRELIKSEKLKVKNKSEKLKVKN